MNRRSFIRLSLLGVSAGIIVPKNIPAAQKPGQDRSKMAGGVYYTQEAPGRWAKKVSSHLPMIEKDSSTGDKTKVRVTTLHPMTGWEHFIIKHILLDQNYKFIAENMFDPNKDSSPVSTFTVEKYTGPLYALSVCNKHDTWLNVLDV
jgi:superoxide reductase